MNWEYTKILKQEFLEHNENVCENIKNRIRYFHKCSDKIYYLKINSIYLANPHQPLVSSNEERFTPSSVVYLATI